MNKKLIPKFQSPWSPINFKAENSQEHRVINNQSSYSSKSVKHSYNTKLNPTYTVGDKREKVEYKEEINPKTRRPYTVQEKDKPLSGTDPVGLFYVEGTALSPIFKYAGIAGKYLLGRFGSGALLNWARSSLISRTMDSDALTGGIKRIVDSSGNVFLRLSSHTKNNPRQLKLEPKGNNQFRVHTQTWNKGSKGDAGLSNIEKQMLYEGLYNELPDGATILFPESRPDYLATRGTVAGLQRLSRDSRFSKGNVLYPLLYLDKNGISTFYGTDFTKNPTLQLPIENNSKSAVPAMTTSNTSSSSTQNNSFKVNLDSKYTKFLSLWWYLQKISGRDPFTEYTRKLGLNAKNNLIHNTIERNIDEMRKYGYSESDINIYRNKAIQELENVKVGHFSKSQYDNAGMEESGGFFDNDNNFISVNIDSKFPTDYIEAHEGRHLLDYRTGLLPHLEKYLNDAFDNNFLNLPNTKYAGHLKGYKFMPRERVTTNRDAREVLLGENIWSDRKLQNAMMDKASDLTIFDAVEKANGYGQRYIRFLRDNNGLTPQKALQFRDAMKYVGVYTGLLAIPTLKNEKNND